MRSRKTSSTSRIRAFVSLTRPLNSCVVALAVLVGILVAGGSPWTWRVLLGSAVAFFLSASSMVINDYCDREIDRLNEPTRPLPSGMVEPSETLWYATVLASLGIFLAALLDYVCLLMALTFFLLALAYNVRGKRAALWGNFAVSACVAAPFLYGAALVKRLTSLVLIVALLAFSSNTAREIAKGIADLRGDRSIGARTLATLLGPKRAAQAAASFYVGTVILSLIPLLLNLLTLPGYLLLGLADASLLFLALRLLRDSSPENSKRVKGWSLMCMVIGMLAFLFSGSVG